MRKTIIIATAVLVLGGIIWIAQQPADMPSRPEEPEKPEEPTGLPPGINRTDFPLEVPPGFEISIFADDLPGARVLTRDSFGNFWVSQTSRGVVSLVEVDRETGRAVRSGAVFRGLRNPHGLAFHPQNESLLYIAEEHRISRVGTYSEDTLHKIADLPSGGGHFTRTIAFGPDNRLYVSIGSSCNVCSESDSRRAKIFSMNDDGSDFKEFARGLRNTVFFTWSYVNGAMWGTDMGRDNLGDDLPPDEINVISGPSVSSGQNSVPNFGWPICYGGGVHDTDFDKNQYVRDPCDDKVAAQVELPAHSAPLGLAFVPEDPAGAGWPEDWWYDLIVAYHGSWNRSVPTGYKLVRIKLDAQGNFGGIEDFIIGWLDGGTVYGRPVDVRIEPGGVMYVTDDKAGLMYKVTYQGDKSDLIRVENPEPNRIIESPLVVRGEARGYWFFEASFPVKLYDADGNDIRLSPPYIMTTAEWMTTNFVPFEAVLEFSPPKTATGVLVLEKDDPSGLPENADSLSIPVRFR